MKKNKCEKNSDLVYRQLFHAVNDVIRFYNDVIIGSDDLIVEFKTDPAVPRAGWSRPLWG